MTYLLIHGGGSTARFWDRLLPHLDAPALAIDLPGRGAHPADLASITVEDEVASVVADVKAALAEDPIILVAHSSGGLVVPGVVAALGDQVEHIVMTAALIPPEGGCGLDGMQPRHAEGLRLALEATRANGTTITLPGPPDDSEPFRTAYGGDPLDDETPAFVVDPVRLVTDMVFHYLQPIHWTHVGDVPVTYICNDRDRPIPLALQEEMIARLPVPPTVAHLDGGHAPAITNPAAFAQILANCRSLSVPPPS